MSHYLEVTADDRPADIGQDDNDRTVYVVNFRFHSVGDITSFEYEIAKLLVDAGLATAVNTDIFIGSKAKVPPSSTVPLITIIATGGFGRDQTHNNTNYERPSCQVTVRASTPVAARDRALAIWRELDGARNFDVVA